MAEIPWRAVIVDEAHRLKNTGSKLLDCMRSVVAKVPFPIYSSCPYLIST